MKYKYILIILFSFFSCEIQLNKKKSRKKFVVNNLNKDEFNSNKNCILKENLKIYDNQFLVNLKDFNIIFKNVRSIDAPSLDFEIANKRNTVVIHQKYLESEFLGDNEFMIQSKSINSIKVKCLIRVDFVFFAEEKKQIALNLAKNIEEEMFCENEIYKISEPVLNFEEEFIEVAKKINKDYWTNVSMSNSYGEIDKKKAKSILKRIENNNMMNSEELFIEKSILSTSYCRLPLFRTDY
ncbi:hypothetical protein [Tenacibaculum maritimum]|uniref:Lipoprotein n=2 Tax=Tenacibaculum maritimum TaxID=107401 RepID=A0A2H1EAJ6_9FLAO|nr:hypothetical protein [Tenacibaculum maritimum]SFZ83319.1 protein of unknown function [Tenacibaculum maritimum NCIMB 2154]